MPKDNNVDDGGPAFPRDTVMGWKGMSLRDWFAGQNMAAMIASGATLKINDQPLGLTLAQAAYIMADAQIAARNS